MSTLCTRLTGILSLHGVKWYKICWQIVKKDTQRYLRCFRIVAKRFHRRSQVKIAAVVISCGGVSRFQQKGALLSLALMKMTCMEEIWRKNEHAQTERLNFRERSTLWRRTRQQFCRIFTHTYERRVQTNISMYEAVSTLKAAMAIMFMKKAVNGECVRVWWNNKLAGLLRAASRCLRLKWHKLLKTRNYERVGGMSCKNFHSRNLVGPAQASSCAAGIHSHGIIGNMDSCEKLVRFLPSFFSH